MSILYQFFFIIPSFYNGNKSLLNPFEQILEAEDCDTVEERKKILLLKLNNILVLKDFCYLNILMRVDFPLSDSYCSESDWQRHTKIINIFEMILKEAIVNLF